MADGKTLLCGRWFSDQEMEEIKETTALFPGLSRQELAKTLCENLEWTAPNGKLKVDSCLSLLQKMEDNGLLTPPQKRVTAPKGWQDVAVATSQSDPEPTRSGTVADIPGGVAVVPVVQKAEARLWKEYVERYHVLGYRRMFGAYQRYFITVGDDASQRLGCLLFSASAWALVARDTWIGWTPEQRAQRLRFIVNNSRFLIFPWVRVKNLASKSLSLVAQRLPEDWERRYGYRPVLLETFVDVATYTGACYKAANWQRLGQSLGRGRMDRYEQGLSTPKWIFVYPLLREFRDVLRGDGDA
jgi:hypothetical protein